MADRKDISCELEQCRQEIDRIDCELTKLLEQRMKVVALVGAYKKEHHMEVFDPRRERLVLDKNRKPCRR